MQLEYYGDEVIVTLSRRNLLALLEKLERGPSTIQKIILPKEGEEPHRIRILTVIAEANDAHYQDKEPGEMDPSTEAYIEREEGDDYAKRADAVARVLGMSWLEETALHEAVPVG